MSIRELQLSMCRKPKDLQHLVRRALVDQGHGVADAPSNLERTASDLQTPHSGQPSSSPANHTALDTFQPQVQIYQVQKIPIHDPFVVAGLSSIQPRKDTVQWRAPAPRSPLPMTPPSSNPKRACPSVAQHCGLTEAPYMDGSHRG